MPIGPVTPGSYTTVTPDTLPAAYASIQVPSPSMPVVASDIATLGLEVLNVQAYSRKAELSATQDIPLAFQNILRVQQNGPWIVETVSNAPGWFIEDTVATIGGDGPMGPIQFDNSAGFAIKKYLRMPHGSTLTSLQVGVLGIGHSAAPGNPPQFFIRKKHLADGLVSTVNAFTATDTAPTPSYDTYRGVNMPPVSTASEIIDNEAYEYWIYITGEHGASSQALGYIVAYVVTVNSITHLDKGGS